MLGEKVYTKCIVYCFLHKISTDIKRLNQKTLNEENNYTFTFYIHVVNLGVRIASWVHLAMP